MDVATAAFVTLRELIRRDPNPIQAADTTARVLEIWGGIAGGEDAEADRLAPARAELRRLLEGEISQQFALAHGGEALSERERSDAHSRAIALDEALCVVIRAMHRNTPRHATG